MQVIRFNKIILINIITTSVKVSIINLLTFIKLLASLKVVLYNKVIVFIFIKAS
jgi:hypothetical protein